jgi:peptidoglycan/LPS O-acetylase OafA/YrhL
MQNKTTYFISLDGLRTIACILVIVAHSFSKYRDLNFTSQNYLSTTIKSFLNLGGEGVSMFFVLSGFLITFLLLKEFNSYNSINLRHFYIRRTLRIWPLFYAVVIYSLFIYPLIAYFAGINHVQNGNILMNLTFLNNFDLLQLSENGNVGFNQQLQITWSVAIEEQFYLIWPLLFLIMMPFKRYFFIFPILFISVFIFKYYSNGNVNYFHSIAAAGDLLIGCLSAFVITLNNKALNFFKTLNNSRRIIIYLIGIYFLLNKSFLFNFLPIHYILTFFYAFVILDQAFNSNNLLKLENLKSITRLGKYTYGMYLLHPIPLLFLKHFFDYSNFSYQEHLITSTILLLLTLFFTILLSYFSYHYFESYFLKIKRKFIMV